MTIATAAAVPQVESQSLHPTMKPAYSPIARREKLYCPPLRGIDAPSSASDEAPKSAYSPPTIHTPIKSHAFGSIFAMSPGVRTIPAAMALPTATAMPNHTPSTCSSLPEPRVCGPAAMLVLVEDSADVLDNVKSQVCIGNSAIIMAMWQNASRKSVILKMAASGFRDYRSVKAADLEVERAPEIKTEMATQLDASGDAPPADVSVVIPCLNEANSHFLLRGKSDEVFSGGGVARRSCCR